jgi:glycosyltransferase involved in cell wall biosynthesis
MSIRFKIITPVYNAEKWIGKCIQSVKDQDYYNFLQIIVDDCSEDNTFNKAKECIGNDKRFVLIKRGSKVGTMQNHILANEYNYKFKDIIVHLDGDDWFFDSKVLLRLNDVYKNKDIWATYGNYKTTDGSPSFCKPILDKNKPIRSYLVSGWIFSQVRSFRSNLLKYLKEEDFKSIDGSYISVADVAVFIPILELCGVERVKFIKDIQMIYNRDNPLNDDKVNRRLVICHARELYHRDPKKCLD